MLRRLRFGVWWNHVVAPLPAVAYFVWIFVGPPPAASWWQALLFLVTLFGTSALGYFLNDFADRQEDRLAGKSNMALALSESQLWALATVLSVMALLPWAWLPLHWGTMGLLGILLTTIFLYSFPPFRFKERGWAGAFCDTLYGHVLPTGITLQTFLALAGAEAHYWPWWPPVLMLLVAKGQRNIFVHQLEDRHNDRRSGANTLVLKMGPLAATRWVNRVILPSEVALLVLCVSMVSVYLPWFWLSLVAFLGFTFLKFSAWKFPSMPTRQLRFKFWYFLNDYYEDWLPLSALLALLLTSGAPFWWLGVHFLLFPSFLLKLPSDMKGIFKNLIELLRSIYGAALRVKEMIGIILFIVGMSFLGNALWLYEIFFVKGWPGLNWLGGELYSPYFGCLLAAVSFVFPFYILKKPSLKTAMIATAILCVADTVCYHAGKEIMGAMYCRTCFWAPWEWWLIGFEILTFYLFLSVLHWATVNTSFVKISKAHLFWMMPLLLLAVPLSLLTIYLFPGFGTQTDWIDAVKMGYPVFWTTMVLGVSGLILAKLNY